MKFRAMEIERLAHLDANKDMPRTESMYVIH